ncbi:MAG: 1-deoxy-D-xylulose-5-phosphate synthase [SAR324 cluster bacterium]|nr:1-deoxy-D-xylulose-5-phosphate synthase [SAR324 cluster bacterium]
MNSLNENTPQSLLDGISNPSQVQSLPMDKLPELADDCRKRMIEVTSKTGGHLASSLGVVDLTIALAKVYDFNKDKIVFDVGHQAYAYKLLTGRNKDFDKLGQKDGIAKFLNRQESTFDHFGAGHASTSISASLGIAVGGRLNKDDFKTIAVIGDGSLTGGLAYEAMNHAGHLEENLIVILNDNEMSIDPVVGALSKTIINISSSKSFNGFRGEISRLSKENKLPRPILNGLKRVNESFMAFFTQGVWFENLNFRYFGQVDGHNLKDLVSLLKHTKNIKGPILLHLSTQKGKGYSFAEDDVSRYHGVSAFNPESGVFHKNEVKGKSYTNIWKETFTEVMEKDDKTVAISAAMLGNTGLAGLEKQFPTRVFDVGIAEGHAVTFAGGLATEKIKPFVVVYSTFLQRAFDHIAHDIALQNLPIRFILDRAGFVGADGATHHGLMDLGYMRMIPKMVVMAPKDGPELRSMIHFAHQYEAGPIALRFARASCEVLETSNLPEIKLGEGELLSEGSDLLLIAIGSMVKEAMEVRQTLEAAGHSVSVINARFVKPLDANLIVAQAAKVKAIATLEENFVQGGFGSAVAEMLNEKNVYKPLKQIGVPDRFFEHATREEQMEDAGLDQVSLANSLLGFLAQIKG